MIKEKMAPVQSPPIDSNTLFQQGVWYQREGKDEAKAAECYQLAAEQGLAEAQCRLGFYYECGIGTKLGENQH